jgi:hypothetical protein
VFRTPVDNDYYGDDLKKYLEERAAKGITADMSSPYQDGLENLVEPNPLGRTVTFVPDVAYSQPVAIMIYGNKVTIMSFGEEAVATIFELAKAGATTMQDKIDA